MRNATALITSGLLAMIVVAPAHAVVDGQVEAAYGAPLSTQIVQTNFGDNNLAQHDYANGSELDYGYGYISGGILHLAFAGNLESNFNKLEVFIDSHPGGQNRLRGDNPNVDFDGLNRMSELNFDNGIEPDYWLSVTGGGGPYQMYANYAELLTSGGGAGYYLGQTGCCGPGALSGGFNPNNIEVTIDNSNVAGVQGGCGPDPNTPVGTGIEFAIPVAALGGPAPCYTVVAFINGGNHDFVSNQVLGPLPPGTCNLGEPHLVDFRQWPGGQYFTVCDQATPAHRATWGSVKTLYR